MKGPPDGPQATEENRRPLASRQAAWAKALARWLAAAAITPNQISLASIGFSALAGLGFWGAGWAGGEARAALLLTAAFGCQLRLICNLMDGMVAIEGGKGAGDGPFWNEFPDRLSDIFIFVGLGLGLQSAALGWAAACLCVLTAYTRELGRTIGLPADFSGPMAKPQRMAVATAAALATLVEPLWSGRGELLLAALWLVTLGAAVTTLRRAVRIVKALT